MIVGFLSIAVAALAVPMTALDEVRLTRASITLADALDMTNMSAAARNRLGHHVIAQLPAGTSRRVSREALASLVRRAVPALRPNGVTGSILFIAPPQPKSVRTGCVALGRPIGTGHAIGQTDLIDGPCPTAVHGLVRFEPLTGSVRAAADLPAGQPLGRLAIPPTAGVAAGTRLTLQSTSGPVAIRREVVALQPGNEGRRIFVRDADGQVMSVTLSLDHVGEPQ